jgi:hypothetical protein
MNTWRERENEYMEREREKQKEEITEEKNGRNTSVVLQSSLLTFFSLLL